MNNLRGLYIANGANINITLIFYPRCEINPNTFICYNFSDHTDQYTFYMKDFMTGLLVSGDFAGEVSLGLIHGKHHTRTNTHTRTVTSSTTKLNHEPTKVRRTGTIRRIIKF